MSKWRDLVLRSPRVEDKDDCVFNPPATEIELHRFEAEIGAQLPFDVREMLLEFNGMEQPEWGQQAPFILGTSHMKLPEFYTDWDVPTDKLLEWSKNIVYVKQFNNFTYLWGVVAKSFSEFQVGDIVEFDHDDIDEDNEASDFFRSRNKNLEEVILD
ncbi:MAG: hypothetical protein Aurels2KO_32520 [Aureliella sp.]